jgi:hypothetical protein
MNFPKVLFSDDFLGLLVRMIDFDFANKNRHDKVSDFNFKVVIFYLEDVRECEEEDEIFKYILNKTR